MSDKKFFKNHVIYKAKKSGDGVASQWQLSYKPKDTKNPYQMFLEVAPQKGTEDENGNATFDWDNKITIKLGLPDLEQILAVLDNRQGQAGTDRGLYHQTPGGGSKGIVFKYNEQYNNYFLGVSSQDANKNVTKLAHTVSQGEAVTLTVLLKRAIEVMYGW